MTYFFLLGEFMKKRKTFCSYKDRDEKVEYICDGCEFVRN